MNTPKHILLAPLDWGLGHTTRCIPIIEAILAQGHQITVAINGAGEKLIKEKFPLVKVESTVPNYNIKYGTTKWSTTVILMTQVFQIKKAMAQEQQWLTQYVANNKVDIIISDNRYGFYQVDIPSIFITHQIAPLSPLGNWANGFLKTVINKYISKFSACWVYDNEAPNALAGGLSQAEQLSIPTTYIGLHTRLTKVATSKKYDFTFILSGPEPQRTILEEKIKQQIATSNYSCVLVLGKDVPAVITDNLKIIGLANDVEISDLLAQSKYIVCRSGYTSLMDYLLLGAQCVVIPTPGQTEQTYLAQYVMEQKYCYAVSQEDFDLTRIATELDNFSFQPIPKVNNDKLLAAINKL